MPNRFFKFIFVVALGFQTLLPAEEATELSNQQRLYLMQQKLRQSLKKKLLNEGGDSKTITVLPIINYGGLTDEMFVKDTVEAALEPYKLSLEINPTSFKLESLSLDSLRLAVASIKTDILVATVVMPTNTDIYIYDKSVPYKIFGQSEFYVEGPQDPLGLPMAEHYSKIAFRKAFYRYLTDDAYDLPRDGSPPILNSEVPRSIASYQAVEMINREANANFYFSANWGAALSSGDSGKLWNSSLISLELGWNPVGKIYLEAAAEISAYNLGVGSVKYLVSQRDEPFRFMFGLGGAVLSDRHTFDWDQSNDIEGQRFYVVPSATILFPISDVYFKLESRAYLGLDERSHIFTFMPGLHIWF